MTILPYHQLSWNYCNARVKIKLRGFITYIYISIIIDNISFCFTNFTTIIPKVFMSIIPHVKTNIVFQLFLPPIPHTSCSADIRISQYIHACSLACCVPYHTLRNESRLDMNDMSNYSIHILCNWLTLLTKKKRACDLQI